MQDGKIVPVEGFVIRGLKKKPTIILDEEQEEVEIIEPFFWKVKFDQPYLMYREWRELTRKILLRYPEPSGIKVEKLKTPLSRLYTDWVEKQVHGDITKFKNWKNGRDIIKIRDEFLVWKETAEGKDSARRLGIEVEHKLEDGVVRVFEKTLIVPIAIPGSGQ